jgi:hypothetical protein
MSAMTDAFFAIFDMHRATCLSCTHSYMDDFEEILCHKTGGKIANPCDAYTYEPGTSAREYEPCK